MPDGTMPPNLAASTGLPESQLTFIQTHLNKDVKKKKLVKQQRLQGMWDRLLENLRATREIVDMVQRVVASKDDAEFVNRQRGAIGKTMSDVSKAKVKKINDAIKAIDTADQEMVAHRKAAMEYLNGARLSGRDMNQEDAIAQAKMSSHAHCMAVTQEFRKELQSVQDKIKQQSGVESVSLGLTGPFEAEMKAIRLRIDAIPQRGDSADLTTAKSTLSDIEKDATALLNGVDGDTSSTGVKGQIVEVGSDPCLPFFADSLKRKARLEAALADLEPVLQKMDRWDCAARTAIRGEMADIQSRAKAVYLPLKQLERSKLLDLEGQQTELIYETETLIRRGKEALEAEAELFAVPQRELERELQALEARMAAVRKTVGSDQRAPMESYLASSRVAIMGLGGCNLDALKPAQSMMAQAREMVLQAENIKAINTQIREYLTRANDTAKEFGGKTDPLAPESKELRNEIGEFAKTFKTLPINDANRQASAFLDTAKKEKARNIDLISNRTAIQNRIDAIEKSLVDFNALYKRVLAHAKIPVEDYQGSYRSELDTCISWNATKTDPSFYSTIAKKLTRLEEDMAKTTATMNDALSKDITQLYLDSATVISDWKEKEAELKRQILAEPDVEKQQELLKEIETARAEFEAKTKETGMLDGFNKEMAARKAAEEQAEKERTEYLAKAPPFLKDAMAEVGKKGTVLHDYADEVKLQIKRVKDSYDLVKNNKPGATGASGLSELASVEKFLDNVRERGEKTSKDDLGKISAQWQDQITKLENAKTSLLTQITDFEKAYANNDTSVSDALGPALSAMIGRAATTSFGKAGSDMAAAENPQAAKAARELALSEVRRIRALLLDDKLFQKCVLNPFSVAIGSTAQNRLEEIELNVLRGV